MAAKGLNSALGTVFQQAQKFLDKDKQDPPPPARPSSSKHSSSKHSASKHSSSKHKHSSKPKTSSHSSSHRPPPGYPSASSSKHKAPPGYPSGKPQKPKKHTKVKPPAGYPKPPSKLSKPPHYKPYPMGGGGSLTDKIAAKMLDPKFQEKLEKGELFIRDRLKKAFK